MILKLIETNDSPKPWLMYKEGCNMFTTWEDDQLPVLKRVGFKVVQPYGISDEEIKEEGDWVIETLNDNLLAQYNPQSLNQRSMGLLNVSILPEHFNYQEIVDLGLKDGDELKFKTKKTAILHERVQRKGYSEKSDITGYVDTIKWENGKVSITKPTPVTYTEEDVLSFIEDAFNELEDRDYVTTPEKIRQWFNLNKKK
jgi:hypothetical protein